MSGLQSTGRTGSLPYPVSTGTLDHGRSERSGETELKKTGGVSASEAFISATHLNILNHFPRKAAMCLGILAVLANTAGLILLLYFFRTSCTLQFGVLPNDWETIDIPESLARLEESGDVTIISTSLVYYQANATFDQLGSTYWQPYAVTCGCDTCNLASCGGTTPISVEYEVCNGWGEAASLATGLLIYVNVTFTLFLGVVLAAVPCARRKDVELSLWDYVKIIAQKG